MPPRGPHSGIACTGATLPDGTRCHFSIPGAVRCNGRMFPVKSRRLFRKKNIDGAKIKEEVGRRRYCICAKCGYRQPTSELPYGGGHYDESIGNPFAEKTVVKIDYRRCLPGMEDVNIAATNTSPSK